MYPQEDGATATPPLTVAFLHPNRGPITRQDWSGTPLGIVNALRNLGIDVVEVGYGTNMLVRRLAHVTSRLITSGPASAERSWIKRQLRRNSQQRQLDSLGRVDAVVAVGTDCYPLDKIVTGAPIATYDDATLATMWNHPESDTRGAGFKEKDVQRWIRTQKASMRFAAVNFVSTNWAAKSLHDDYNIPSGRVVAVGMGHEPLSTCSSITRDWDNPNYLFVGVDWRRKNGAAVIRAFKRIREIKPTATLHLVGLHEKIHEENVIDHGLLARNDPEAQTTLSRLYQLATVFILPSRFDPSPIASLEAASAGLPVISTSEGGAGELLGDGALIVSPFDEEEIFRAMLSLADPSEAMHRGSIAKAHAGQASWQHVAVRIMEGLGFEMGKANVTVLNP